jgi:uncharacterized damage-inducible protein DinB
VTNGTLLPLSEIIGQNIGTEIRDRPSYRNSVFSFALVHYSSRKEFFRMATGPLDSRSEIVVTANCDREFHMAIRDTLLPEFDQEMANTRKMLERVPEDRFDFQPHQKCWKVNRLAGHIADLPSWVSHTMSLEVLALEPGQYSPFEPTTRKELLERFDNFVQEARTAIAAATDEELHKVWTMKWEGKEVMSMPRASVLRSVIMNHLIHHRAHLGMYLRLMDVAVPGMYGASADEAAFGASEKAA